MFSFVGFQNIIQNGANSLNSVVSRYTLRAVAVLEALKGVLAFGVLFGILDLMHRDVRHVAMELIGHFGLNPDARYPSLLLYYADRVPIMNVHSLVIMALLYIALRMTEAYGLWNQFKWGEWLGTVSGGLYVPFEIHHIAHHPSIIGVTVLIGNVLIVVFLAFQLRARHANTSFVHNMNH
jgi:uncharacterized membrane protein (DUF2068 family)